LDIVESSGYRFGFESHEGAVRFAAVRLDRIDVTEHDGKELG
jgi:hypothetical protein